MGMWFWRDGYFASLKKVATAASSEPKWSHYAHYCEELEKGLRKQALQTLTLFITDFEAEPFVERQRFVRWLLRLAYRAEGSHMLVPYPLSKRIISPTLRQWKEMEPDALDLRRWRHYIETEDA